MTGCRDEVTEEQDLDTLAHLAVEELLDLVRTCKLVI